MTQKFDRRYRLLVDPNPNAFPPGANPPPVAIALPYSMEFTVNRQTLATGQDATIRILNLAGATRDQLYKDPWWTTQQRYLTLFAGYKDFMPRIFYGLLMSCISWREGVSTITEFKANSLLFDINAADADLAIAPNATASAILARLNQALPGASPNPIIGRFPAVYPRAYVLSGKIWQNIQAVSNGLAVMDNGTLTALNDDEAVANASLPLISSASGIIGTPKRGQQAVELSLIFEPRFTLLQVVQLQSAFSPVFNGTYKVQGFRHAGTISHHVAGPLQTDVTLFRPGQGPFAPSLVSPSPTLP